eukprot:2327924-Pleurochrysis_carterae.AAC.3
MGRSEDKGWGRRNPVRVRNTPWPSNSMSEKPNAGVGSTSAHHAHSSRKSVDSNFAHKFGNHAVGAKDTVTSKRQFRIRGSVRSTRYRALRIEQRPKARTSVLKCVCISSCCARTSALPHACGLGWMCSCTHSRATVRARAHRHVKLHRRIQARRDRPGACGCEDARIHARRRVHA